MTQLAGYIVAFALCLAIFARVRSRSIRQPVLLIASYALYLSWGMWFAIVLLASTVANFLIGRGLRRHPSARILFLGIAFNLALLGAFKYLPEASVHLPLSSLQQFAHFAMPLGISFWTFQAMSYLFDLYQGEEIDPTFFEFALYMVFFPVTISGPVCRLSEVLPQFRSVDSLRGAEIWRGFQRIAIGVLMLQVAKLLGQGILGGDGITSGFDRVTRWSGPDVWCLAFGYALQIFPGSHSARKFCPSLRLYQPLSILDTLAHVALVLDSRLSVLPTHATAKGNVVAKPVPGHCDDAVRPVA